MPLFIVPAERVTYGHILILLLILIRVTSPSGMREPEVREFLNQ